MAPDGCRIGIRVRMEINRGRTVMDPIEYSRFFAQEAHLRAAVERAGLTLVPLGYITNQRVQYEIRAIARVAGQAPGERRAAVKAAVVSLVCRARRAKHRTGTSPRGDDTPRATGSAPVNPDVASGAQSHAPSAVPDHSREGNADSAAPDAGGLSGPMRTVADPIQDRQLRKDVKLGPPIITIDGDDVAWASALDRAPVSPVASSRPITCEFGPPERHVLDRHNRRYRSVDPHQSKDIREGSILEMNGTKSETVLIATVSNQGELRLHKDDTE